MNDQKVAGSQEPMEKPGMTPAAAGEDDKPAKRSRAGGLLSLAIRDKNALYASYMTFVRGGGLFIPTTKPYKQGK